VTTVDKRPQIAHLHGVKITSGDRHSRMTPQERQRPLIEFLDALVRLGVRAPVKHEQFGVGDAEHHVIGETSGCELIASPDGEARRSENSSQMCPHVMSEDGIGLPEEIRHALRRLSRRPATGPARTRDR
jgi:hypothetical protein